MNAVTQHTQAPRSTPRAIAKRPLAMRPLQGVVSPAVHVGIATTFLVVLVLMFLATVVTFEFCPS